MDNNRLKLIFLQRVLTDTVGNDEIIKNLLYNNIYPSSEIMESIISLPVDHNRLNGLDWPQSAYTMIGVKRMENLHESLDYIRLNNIHGDFIETGVWRGGASIFAKKYFDFYGMNRKVFVVDSFRGLPPPQIKEDEGDIHHTIDYLRVSLPEVKKNFELFDALDENVIFVEGWFEDTLPNNHLIDKICILRMDGDMYKSTMDVFNSCYHKVETLGRIIIDDFCIPNCRKAVHRFREENSINDEMIRIDDSSVYWIKR